MSYQSNSFRVFVSSTFKDMEAERNYLQKFVFPRLKHICKSYGFEFQAVDLRWGIDEEASIDQNGVKICLDELKRCQEVSPRPNLIVLLGERYGWTPPPAEIPEIEFQKLFSYIRRSDRKLVEFWYKLDTNSIFKINESTHCGTYKLAPRRGIHAKWKEYTEWEPVERQLREILYNAAIKSEVNAKNLLKYYSSATHQEIISGVIEPADAKNHVHFFMKNISGVSPTEKLKDFVETDSTKKEYLERLKMILRKDFSDHVHEYSVNSANSDAFKQYLEEFGRHVFDALWTNINMQINRFVRKSELEQESESQMAFAQTRTKIFVGRNAVLEKIMDYIHDTTNDPLIIMGPSGSGKSALIAKLVHEIHKSNPASIVLPRFIGTTVKSSNSLTLLTDLYQNIVKMPNISFKTTETITDKTFTDYPKFARYFTELVSTCDIGDKAILLIDAIDQLRSNDMGRDLQWIPQVLGKNIKIVISCALDAKDLVGILDTRFKTRILHIPPLSIQEGDEILKLLLKDTSRALTSSQSDEILMKFKKLGNPLFLKVAFEISRRWNSFDPPESTILPDNIEALVEQYLSSLMIQYDSEFVKRVLGYLVTSRYGLTESEIVEILSFDSEYFTNYYLKKIFHPLPEPRLPWIVWSRFFAVMEQFFTQSGIFNVTTFSLFHRQFKQIITTLFLPEKTKKRFHRILAEYFAQKPLYYKEGEKKTVNYRKLSELIYHLRAAEMFQEIEYYLTDLEYIDVNCGAGLIDALLQDFSEVMQVNTHQWKDPSILQEIYAFLRNQSHIIRKFPQLCLQQAVNQSEFQNLAKNAEIQLLNPAQKQPFIKLLNKPQERNPLVLTFQGHHSPVNDCCFSPDGSIIASVSADSTIILWNSKTGARMKTLYGHSKEVNSCDFTQDGSKILSGSSDGTLKLWDVQSGTTLKTYTFDGIPIEDSRLSRDGSTILVASNEGSIRLVDTNSGSIITTFKGHGKAVKCCRFSPDESMILSSSDDYLLKLWDVEKSEEIFTLEGHTGWINTCAFSPNGETVISGSYDQSLRVWDVKSSKELASFRTGSFMNWINACAYSPDGSVIAFGCGSSIIIWNPKTNEQLANIYNGDYYSITFSPDGSQLLTGCRDSTLKLWDVNTMMEVYLLHGTRDILSEKILGFSPNGSIFITVESQYSLKLMDSVTDAQYIVKLWDSHTKKELKSLKGHLKDITCYDFSPDSTQLVTGSIDHTLIIWDIASGTALHVLRGHTTYLKLCSYSLDGQNIISLSNENTVKTWDVKSGKEVNSKSNPVKSCTMCSISPDKTKILVIGSSRNLKLWNLLSENPPITLEGFYTDPMHYAFAFSPDSLSFITKIGKNELAIWDAQTGVMLRSFTAHSRNISTCLFNPNGDIIVTGSLDRTIKLWDIHTGENIKTLTGHSKTVVNSIFSLDGDFIISGSDDETIRMWDLETGKNVAIFPEARFLREMAINKNGLLIAIDSTGLKMMELRNYDNKLKSQAKF
ncbi:MAG: DUF4062 domain-containing protein [Candidatus Lokiarchaeota archaeon]|nr:DUF4062 domain-containing protein [Candidatus Lokiarchaeota archaeon]